MAYTIILKKCDWRNISNTPLFEMKQHPSAIAISSYHHESAIIIWKIGVEIWGTVVDRLSTSSSSTAVLIGDEAGPVTRRRAVN